WWLSAYDPHVLTSCLGVCSPSGWVPARSRPVGSLEPHRSALFHFRKRWGRDWAMEKQPLMRLLAHVMGACVSYPGFSGNIEGMNCEEGRGRFSGRSRFMLAQTI